MGNAERRFALEYTQSKPNTATEGFSPVYVCPNKVKKISTRTLHEVLKAACEKYADLNCIGYQDCNFQWLSFEQAFETALHIGQGLLHLDLFAKDPPQVIGICTQPRHEALLIDMALVIQSVPSVHFHPLDDICKVLSTLQPLLIFCDESSSEILCQAHGKCEKSKLVCLVQFEQVMEKTLILAREHNLRIIHLNEVIARSAETSRIQRFSTCYSFAYSSNYEFNLIAHSNIVSNLEGISSLTVKCNDTYYSYQSLCVLQERVLIYHILKNGGKIGFGQFFFQDVPMLFPSILLLNRWYLKSIFDQISQKEKKALWKVLPKPRIILTNSAGISSEMLSQLMLKLSCPIIRIFGNNLCGIIVTSNLNDVHGENTGGLIPGVEGSLKAIPELSLSVKDINGNNLPEPKGVLYVKGSSISICGLDFPLDTSDRGVCTGLIFKRSSNNGSMAYMGAVENAWNEGIPEHLEGSFLLSEEINDIFFFQGPAGKKGVIFTDKEISIGALSSIEPSVSQWYLTSPLPGQENFPYSVSRNQSKLILLQQEKNGSSK